MNVIQPALAFRVLSDFDYAAEPKEHVGCNLCGTPPRVIRQKDRYGFEVGVVRCPSCELLFLCPRMTAEAYRRFYETGAYRRLVSAFHGREINAQTIQPEQEEYGRRLADMLEPWVTAAGNVLDVGGSTGVVARILGQRFACVPTVLDPAPAELVQAEADLYTARGTIEGFDSGGVVWDVVTLCQTVDHLLDPMAALRKIRGLLAPGGLFWVDALDYDKTRTIKIDHPYNFTERTMLAYLSRAGFKVLLTDRHNDHVGFVCRGAA